MKSIDKDIVISDLLYKSLYGDLSEDERTMLECWLKDEQNRAFYEELQQPEKLYGEVLEMADLDTGKYYRNLQGQINRKRRLRLWLAVASVAAVLLLSWLVSPLWQQQIAEPEAPYRIVRQTPVDRTLLKTGQGTVHYLADSVRQISTPEILADKETAVEQQIWADSPETEYNLLVTSSRGNIEVTLADSSRVWLNAGSQLRYPNRFTGNSREVELVGEAYFEVARNEHQPFIVRAGTTRIEVLGTQFNVEAKAGNSCITTLVKGSVKVRNKLNDSVVIHPGQQVKVPKEGAMTVKSVDLRFPTAWRRNRFAFQNEPLYRIMEQLSEWYGCTFEFRRPQQANLHFTTMIPRYDDITEVLGILQATGEFRFTSEAGHIRISAYEDGKQYLGQKRE